MKVKVVRYNCDRCGKEFTEEQILLKDVQIPAWELDEEGNPTDKVAAVQGDFCAACAKKVIKVKYDPRKKKFVF